MLSCLICVLKAQSWKKACGDTGCTLLALSSGLSEVVVLGLEMRFPDRRLVGGSPRGNKKVVVGKQKLSWNERAWDQRKEAESAVLLQVGMEYFVQSDLSNSCRSRSQQKHFCPTRLDCFYSEVCWSAHCHIGLIHSILAICSLKSGPFTVKLWKPSVNTLMDALNTEVPRKGANRIQTGAAWTPVAWAVCGV